VQNGKLRAQRKLRGWSQEDLVRELVALGIELGEKQLGVTRSLISRWECGVTHPRAPYPKLLCRVFNTTAEELGLVPPSPLPVPSITMDGTTIEDGGDDVERRDFLRVASTAAVGAFLPWKAWPLPDGSLDLDDLVSITSRYCRLAPTVPSATLLEAMLLKLLVQNAGRVVTKGEILEKVWNVSADTETRAVDNFIVRLRRYLEPNPRFPKHLLTVRGAGYRLLPDA